MDRRRFLVSGLAGGLGTLAGCTGSPNGETPADATATPGSYEVATPDSNPEDGYPPVFEDTPEERSIQTGSYDTVEENGVEVPLAPIEDVEYWYFGHEARFADARGTQQYEDKHILGAVSSPAPEGGSPDPVADWPKDARIVCYCGCPHHLSSIRASHLIAAGYENVYVIDEGFWKWYDRGLPIAGENTADQPQAIELRGVTDARYAGHTAWARHVATDQQEATRIDDAGNYLLELRFSGLSPGSIIEVETPAYTVREPLQSMRSSTITG